MRLSVFDRLAAGAYGLLALEAALGWSPRLSLCLFRAVTGLPCPGCGMGHALVLAFEGRWRESFSAHPLGLPLLVVWTAYLAWGAANAARDREFSQDFPRLSSRAAWTLLGALLLSYVRRFA